MKRVIIYGAGGHGKVVCDNLEHDKDIEIVGFLDSDSHKKGEDFFGYKVLGGEELLQELIKSGVGHAIIAIGDNEERKKIANLLHRKGFNFLTAVHPSASLSRGVKIGEGTVIMAGAIVNADTTIGKHVILNTASIVEHDSNIADYTHIAPGVCLGGTVTVGELALVGIGASVIPKIHIGRSSIVGAGAVLVKDVPDGVVVVGNPARILDKGSG